MADKDENKKVKTAVALGYDPNEDGAPVVIASGKGALAEKIIEQAQENKIPVHEDSKLADTLSKLEIGEMIPPELYEVVAEILVFVDAMDKIKAKDKSRR
ncbi:MAG: EscU/YscU/HrcU family type III secretion system export apparatus switch protein [Butyrivibrio sp.]|jgi:flagellar biosynthesis protein|uniref:Flagellar biosynthesis protein n=1 Tax=Butyrivibrio hungatei TaxID=185008 RepID=A0A1G5EIE9_9FIRM|nr:EscU/YscU/HrcU family type III secretion system export apparatus switch protein [Butyrivibrio hungatei]MBQ2609035.1 EscU/YscU/HrcU family type III secretion system export apparatus switch protein [Butyrivibrio sp.]MBQ4219106.1 EscU/YscU/HrcU family type III secretion system export apparatus switch protein [Butyrivibrio sp.]MEE3469621.1 EscU/YscU/HrcU family type III secretion system export apparatus switch protein [Butyrivibrio hungatei]SCY26727.1 flagellar biosynthesis protein [Butyrivibrio